MLVPDDGSLIIFAFVRVSSSNEMLLFGRSALVRISINE